MLWNELDKKTERSQIVLFLDGYCNKTCYHYLASLALVDNDSNIL
mgnify:FL=1